MTAYRVRSLERLSVQSLMKRTDKLADPNSTARQLSGQQPSSAGPADTIDTYK